MDIQGQQTYRRRESAVFLKTAERFGGLSNMAAGYPLCINRIHIKTSEALYQACRFPHIPDVQGKIIGQASPMTAKMVSKPYRKDSRPDWDEVRIDIMWWCLRVKLALNWEKFADLLLSTGDMPIVEESYRDSFWGAKPIDGETLVGTNVLGRLLTGLREQLRGAEPETLRTVEPPNLPQFLLNKRPIGVIGSFTQPGTSSAPGAGPFTYHEYAENTTPANSIAEPDHHDESLPASPETVLSLSSMHKAPDQLKLFA